MHALIDSSTIIVSEDGETVIVAADDPAFPKVRNYLTEPGQEIDFTTVRALVNDLRIPAKAALAHYTRLSALDLCPRIRVNAIAPGSIMTSALEIVASNDALREPMEKATPLRRLGEPDDIAAAAVYLASPAASFLTGKMLEVDGGLIVPNLDLPIPDL
jgi:hypothetical protein